jgi:cystathionine beta-synthase
MSGDMPAHRRPYDSVLDVIGWTPLIRLNRVVGDAATPVYGKAEFMNPGGSVKDRIGITMIEAAEAEGKLKPGGVIVEGTAGNTGVGLAIAACVKGYRCIFTMPDKFSQEKIRLMRAFGAEVIITPTAVPPDHPDNYLNVARRIVERTPNAVMADQFYNPANPEAHYRTTGPEIWEQTEGRITHLVCAAGTGGTLTGIARYLKERNPAVKIIAGDPKGSIYEHYFRTREVGPHAPYKVEGVGNDRVPTTLDFDLIDEFRVVEDRDSLNMARRLTREEGLFVGGSSGLNVCVAVQVAKELDDPDALVVCLLPDTGERYLSKIYSDDWMRENQLLEEEVATIDALLRQKPADTPPLISVEPTSSVREALLLIEENNVSQLPVIVGGRCVGCVSESVLMARLVEDPALIDASVEALMEPPLPTVDADADFETVTNELISGKPAVLVRRNGEPVGIVTRFDVVHYLIGFGHKTRNGS